MTSYVDTSAILKRYVDEPDSELAANLLAGEDELVTGRHTIVEVRRNLARLLIGTPLAESRSAFASDLAAFSIVELDAATCDLSATIAEQTGARTLDALHLGAARRVGTGVTFVTFDLRQGILARTLGFSVAGV